MKSLLLGATILAAIGANPANAAVVTVADVGSILNESKALPAESTPGLGVAFVQFFTFTLPTREEVTASVSDSGIGTEKIVGGVLSLNTQIGTGPAPLDIPLGTLIDSSPFTNTIGGQTATVGPDILNAGSYFAEVSGTSGASAIKLAIDGTITASTVPEASTWIMIAAGFGLISMFGLRGRKTPRLDLNSI
jgi:hypothetical protein